MSTAYSGVEANVKVGGTDVDAQGWSIDVEVDTFDSTTTADGGWHDETAAAKKLGGSFEFFWNTNKAPFGTLALTPGTTFTGEFYINLSAGNKITGTGLVKKVSVKTKIKDGVMMTCSFVNKGIWVLPTT